MSSMEVLSRMRSTHRPGYDVRYLKGIVGPSFGDAVPAQVLFPENLSIEGLLCPGGALASLAW
jgi:hypothetical protein